VRQFTTGQGDSRQPTKGQTMMTAIQAALAIADEMGGDWGAILLDLRNSRTFQTNTREFRFVGGDEVCVTHLTTDAMLWNALT